MFGLMFGNVQTEEGYMSQDLRGEMLRTICFLSVQGSHNPWPLSGLELGLDSWFESWEVKSLLILEAAHSSALSKGIAMTVYCVFQKFFFSFVFLRVFIPGKLKLGSEKGSLRYIFLVWLGFVSP